jgi:hypothetical protein
LDSSYYLVGDAITILKNNGKDDNPYIMENVKKV